MKKSILPVIPVLILILLLLFPSLSFEGAKSGLLLWFNVVLPTLLPFMLCSSLLVAWGGVPVMIRPFKPLFKLFSLSDKGSYALMAGMLCGYPMGAKTTADFIREGSITGREGKRLLAMAGCPSPMFVAGYIHSNLDGSVPFLSVVASVYIPVILIGLLARMIYGISEQERGERCRTAASPCGRKLSPSEKQPFDEIMMSSLEIMVKIGGYIMLYSILARFICEAPMIPPQMKPLLTGFVEMTTGIDAVSRTMSGLPAALVILFSASFGGLSGVSQTNTVIKNAGLSIRHYILWKLLHGSLSCMLLILLSSP